MSAARRLWVFDRGFDGGRFIEHLETLVERWIIRQRGDRHIHLAGDSESHPTEVIGEALELKYVAQPFVSLDNKLRRVARFFGYCSVQLVPGGRFYTLLAVAHPKADAEQPRMLLLSSVRVRNPRQARKLVEAYYRRWSAEDQVRADKQLNGLEDVRVLGFTSLTNLLALTTVASGLLAHQHATRPRRTNALIREAPIVPPIPPFPLYRLHCMVQLILRRTTALRRMTRRNLA